LNRTHDKPELDPLRIVEAEFKAGATAAGQLPAPTGVEIAFAGRSNVGKSSLMNALCGRRNLVNTSSTPGCTRQISFFETRSADGAIITLVDLPGYGYAKRSKSERSQWADLIESYLMERPTLAVVASLVDVRRGLEDDDRDLLTMLQGEPRVSRLALRAVLVGTKLDKLPANQRKLAVQAFTNNSPIEAHGVSANLPVTHQKLWRRLRRLANVGASTDELGKQISETDE
jgi:GTP-binding protein